MSLYCQNKRDGRPEDRKKRKIAGERNREIRGRVSTKLLEEVQSPSSIPLQKEKILGKPEKKGKGVSDKISCLKKRAADWEHTEDHLCPSWTLAQRRKRGARG